METEKSQLLNYKKQQITFANFSKLLTQFNILQCNFFLQFIKLSRCFSCRDINPNRLLMITLKCFELSICQQVLKYYLIKGKPNINIFIVVVVQLFNPNMKGAKYKT